MTEAEAEKLIDRSRKALRSHTNELRWSPEQGDIRAAMSATLSMLEDVAREHPTKRAEINALVAHFSGAAYSS